MSSSYVYTLNGKYQNINDTIEHFGISIGNIDDTKDSTLIKEVKNIQETIDENTVIAGCASLLSTVITEVASKNSQDLTKLFSASNNITISGLNTGGDVNYSSNQTSTISMEQREEINQTLSSKIINDINKTLKGEIQKMVNAERDRQKLDEENNQDATNLGNMLTGVADTVGNTASDILDMSIGNSTRKTKELEINKEFNSKMKVERNFTMKKNDEISEELSNKLSMDNISKAIQNTKSGNDLSLKNITAEEGIDIMGVKQKTAVNAVMKNLYNQSVLIEISTKIVASYDSNVEQMIKSADKEADITKKTSTNGDIYAAGVAGKQILEGVGEASKGIGEGVSTGAQGVGEGVATGAKGIGEGAASALRALALPLLIGGIVLVIMLAIYAYGKNQGWF
tara:strand:- start:905 stop:2098 length:1194 start_codon:yes stop_codon:yes gene_type:complete